MKKILVIEDNEVNQILIARWLKKNNYEVFFASTGVEGLASARSILPDLILLDMSIPKKDGWQVASEIRLDDNIKNIPIIAITAHAMAGDREKTILAGCNDYEAKPINFANLKEKMNRLIG